MHFYISPRWNHGGLQWDGKYFTVLMNTQYNSTCLKADTRERPVRSVDSKVFHQTAIATIRLKALLSLSPRAARSTSTSTLKAGIRFSRSGVKNPQGVAISVPPPGKRIRE